MRTTPLWREGGKRRMSVKVEIRRDKHRLTPLRLGEDSLVRLTAKAEVQDVLGLVAGLARVARQRAR